MKLNLLEEKRLEKNMSIRQLAIHAKVGYATAYDILKAKTVNPKISTLKNLAAVLEIKISDIF